MAREKLPHEELVFEIKKAVADANLAASVRWDDDMDQYYAEKAGFSPMEQVARSYGEHMKRAESLAAELAKLGSEAAPAVAKGLRTRGRWRELLLPFARAHLDDPDIEATLVLLGKRTIDPLATEALRILDGAPSAPDR